MIQHIELAIKFDLTCSGRKEDFEADTNSSVKEWVMSYILDNPEKLIDNLKINKIWYEEEEIGKEKEND